MLIVQDKSDFKGDIYDLQNLINRIYTYSTLALSGLKRP